MFEAIAGYEDVKEELIRIRQWIFDRENIDHKDAKLPKGVLFYGKPGNGKTLFLREFAKSFGHPIISIESEGRSAAKRIHQAFVESKENAFTIILIDEVDLLLGYKEDERALRSELDGVDSNPNVLVLATTNSLSQIDDALLRSGRFDRVIYIDDPDGESRRKLLLFYAEKLGIVGDIDFDFLSRMIALVSCAEIAAIVNDVCLRCGQKATTGDFETSFRRICKQDYALRFAFDPSKANREIAYHESAHALLLHKNSGFFIFYEALYGKDYKSGTTRWFPIEDEARSADFYFQQIEVSIAGYVMTKLKFHKLDGGSVMDLQKCRESAIRLVNKLGYLGPQYVLPFFSKNERMETETCKRRNEKAAEKIIHSAEKRVKRYLKAHMAEADALAVLMMKKGRIDVKDLASVMESKKTARPQTTNRFAGSFPAVVCPSYSEGK